MGAVREDVRGVRSGLYHAAFASSSPRIPSRSSEARARQLTTVSAVSVLETQIRHCSCLETFDAGLSASGSCTVGGASTPDTVPIPERTLFASRVRF